MDHIEQATSIDYFFTFFNLARMNCARNGVCLQQTDDGYLQTSCMYNCEPKRCLNYSGCKNSLPSWVLECQRSFCMDCNASFSGVRAWICLQKWCMSDFYGQERFVCKIPTMHSWCLFWLLCQLFWLVNRPKVVHFVEGNILTIGPIKYLKTICWPKNGLCSLIFEDFENCIIKSFAISTSTLAFRSLSDWRL